MTSQEAAYWYIRCSDERAMRYADRKLFLAWLKESPQNIAELLLICDLDGGLGHRQLVDKVKELGDTNVVEGHFGGGVALYDYQPSKHVSDKVKRKTGLRWAWKVAAGVATLTLTAMLGHAVLDRPDGVFETVASEWQHKSLEDGSSIHMDARTRLKVEFTDEQRIVRLDRGRAAFEVAKNPHRPFIVRTPLVDVVAVGTRFSVDIDVDAGVTTIVEEGVVKVIKRGAADSTAVRLVHDQKLHVAAPSAAGEAVRVAEQDRVHVDSKADLEWTTGWVYFHSGDTVGEMVKEFKRRHNVEVLIEDPTLAEQEVHWARMKIDSIEDFSAAMDSQKGVAVIEDLEHKTLRLLPE